MDNNELNNNVNEDTGIFPDLSANVTPTTPNEPLSNSALDNQLFTDDSLNNFGGVNQTNSVQSNSNLNGELNLNQTSVNNVTSTPSVDLSSQSLQSNSIPVNEEIKPQVNTPANDSMQSLNTSTPINNNITEPVKEEPKVEPKQKKSKGPVVIIILLLLIVLGLAGYIAYDKFLSKDTKEPETKEEKTTLKEVKDKALVEELRSGLVATDSGALVEGLYHNYKITSSDANNKELLIFNILKYVEENKINIHETKSTIDTGVQQDIKATISKADITTYMQNKYNTNLDYAYKASKQYDNVGTIGYLAVLADDTNYYIASIPGGEGSYYLNTKLVKAEEDKNNIYIYDKAVYSIFALNIADAFDTLDLAYDQEKHEYTNDLLRCEDDPTTVEQDIKKSDKCPFTGTMENVTPDSVSKYVFENISDKLKTFKHTFKKLDGNYFWVSSEVVE